jgi:hypothetical protein
MHEIVSEAGRLNQFITYICFNGHYQAGKGDKRRWPKPRIFILAGFKNAYLVYLSFQFYLLTAVNAPGGCYDKGVTDLFVFSHGRTR